MDDDTKRELVALAAESMAVQAILCQLARRVSAISPELSAAVIDSFDDAANFAEKISLAKGKASGHLPESLRIIEDLRRVVTGHDKPKHGV